MATQRNKPGDKSALATPVARKPKSTRAGTSERTRPKGAKPPDAVLTPLTPITPVIPAMPAAAPPVTPTVVSALPAAASEAEADRPPRGGITNPLTVANPPGDGL